MPTNDLDLPLRSSADQIRRQDFPLTRRGYDPQQVRSYLTSIAKQMGTLERELSRLRLEAASAAARSEQMADPVTTSDQTPPAEDPYGALSKRFATLIETADQEAEKIVENARSEATRALEEAASEADQTRRGAQAHAEETRHEVADLRARATRESDRVLSGLAERRRSLVTQLEEIRGKLMSVAEDLAVPLEDAARIDPGDHDLTDTSGDDEADERADAGAPIDPRYEDLWLKKDEPLQIPDLASLDLDLGEREQ
ncbi:MAG: DivIVA domain-containing protein [Actinomycetota bacterium]